MHGVATINGVFTKNKNTFGPQSKNLASIMRGFIAISIFAFALSAAFGMTGVWLAFPAAEFVTMFIIVKGLRKNYSNYNR